MEGRVEKWVVMGEGRMGEDGRDREKWKFAKYSYHTRRDLIPNLVSHHNHTTHLSEFTSRLRFLACVDRESLSIK